jgi:hypothetical protein
MNLFFIFVFIVMLIVQDNELTSIHCMDEYGAGRERE